jgi:Peptidase M76 family
MIRLLQAGCRMPEERICVKHCEAGVLGSYDAPDLTICYNNYQGRPAELRNTIVHELVHAYDFCRARNLDFFNCRHLACTEASTPLAAALPARACDVLHCQMHMVLCCRKSVVQWRFRMICWNGL